MSLPPIQRGSNEAGKKGKNMWRMIRNLVFLFLLAVFIAWMIQDPGSVRLEWRGYELRSSLFVALAAISLAVALLMIIMRLLSSGLDIPRQITERRKARRLQEACRLFCDGMTAAVAHDKQHAILLARKGLERMDSEAEQDIGMLLATRIVHLAGDTKAAEEYARKMLARPEMEFLAARSLFVQAKERDDNISALEYARRALRLRKDVGWAAQEVFEHAASNRQWREALDALDIAQRARTFEPEQERRYRAVVLAALAMQAESENRFGDAVRTALESVSLLPGFAPIAVLAARLCVKTGKLRKGEKLLETAWNASPHPELADSWMKLYESESFEETAKRMERLVHNSRTHPESRIALATTRIATREWSLVRSLLAPLSEVAVPSERVCSLMAQAEAGQGNLDARDAWLARAKQAPRSACWYCDDFESSSWQPICPSNGAFDTMRWGAPPSVSHSNLISNSKDAMPPPPSDKPKSPVPVSPPDDPGIRLHEASQLARDAGA